MILGTRVRLVPSLETEEVQETVLLLMHHQKPRESRPGRELEIAVLLAVDGVQALNDPPAAVERISIRYLLISSKGQQSLNDPLAGSARREWRRSSYHGALFGLSPRHVFAFLFTTWLRALFWGLTSCR